MTRLEWGAVGARYYEYGVDRGVLYAGGGSGVPWNGLTGVNESQDGGEVSSYYFDGIKYLDVVANEDFKATITALSAPPEFDQCQGKKTLAVGLFATGQQRVSFGMSYRTLIGNDTVGPKLGYKLHIVYNCTAAPADRGNKSTGSGAVDPNEYSWTVSTVPVIGTTYKPTAHFIIDSTQTPTKLLAALEDILYGSASTTARLPSQSEVVTLFTSPPIAARNMLVNPSFEVDTANWVGSGITISQDTPVAGMLTSGGVLPSGSKYMKGIVTGSGTTTYLGTLAGAIPVVAGQWLAGRVRLWVTANRNVRARVLFYDAGGVAIGTGYYTDYIGGSSINFGYEAVIPAQQAPIGAASARFLIYAFEGVGSNASPTTTYNFYVDAGFVVVGATQADADAQNALGYFDGSTPDTASNDYSWEGAANASTSVLKTWS